MRLFSNPFQRMEPGRLGLYAGTFLIALALLSFEVSTVRTINFTIGPSFIYFAIALAMLGLSAAGSLLSLIDLEPLRQRRERVLFWTCLAIALLLIATHFLAASEKADHNAAVEAAGRIGGIEAIARELVDLGVSGALTIGALLSLPYFLFGALLAFLFATTGQDIYGRLYAADLVGAAIGCIAAIVAMETTSYAASVTAPSVVAVLAGTAYVARSDRRLALVGLASALVLAVLPAIGVYASAVEPPADRHYLARDYDYERELRDTWHGWNSYSRVGAIDYLDDSRYRYDQMSLNNGDGIATLYTYDPGGGAEERHLAAVPALLLDPPLDALVFLAGVGADLLSFHQNAPDYTRVTGVELNGMMVDGALGMPRYRLRELLANDNVTLEVAEGRTFLERHSGQYDLILFSWSGVTAAYYAGALAGTTQFLFTDESLFAALDRLKPGGYLVILQISKVNAVAMLRRYMEARGLANPEDAAVVLFRPDDAERAWDRSWDDNPMLIKPDGWTAEEVARLRDNGRAKGLYVAYAPGLPSHPDYTVYERLLSASDYEAEFEALRAETGLRFGQVTDDRPFYLDLFLTEHYWSGAFWSRVMSGNIRTHEAAQLARVALVIAVSIAAAVLVLLPLAFRRGPRAGANRGSHLGYFFCLGSGFMILEIVLMQKGSLLFGNPGLTIAVVLAAIVLFTGLGSLMSNRTFAGGLSFRLVTAGIIAYGLMLYFGLDGVLNAMLGWPMVAKSITLMAIIAPGALLMGHLFPQGLAAARQDDPALVPWAWGINGATGTVAAGLTPLLAQAWGFDALILLGTAIYAAILLLPAYRPSGRALDAAGRPALVPAE